MKRGWTAFIVVTVLIAFASPFLIPMGVGIIASSTVIAASCQMPILRGDVPKAVNEAKSASLLPSATVKYLEKRGVYERAEQNMERYLAAQKTEGVPWQVMAAIHYREAGMNPNSSISNGAPLGSGKNVDNVNVVADANQDAINMARHLKRMAKYVYDIDITKQTMTMELWGEAFLAYNRGFLYKNKGRTYDQSPYVMNGFDETHLNMRWIDADTVSGVDGNKAGALTVLVYLNGGSFNGSGINCSGASSVAIGGLHAPLSGEALVISPYDPARYHPILHITRPHNGTDLVGGPDIQAISGGTVIWSGPLSGFGNYVKIDHGNGFYSSYAHLSSIALGIVKGVRVNPGQFLGFTGQTGLAAGVHLHIQIWVNDGKGNSNLTDPEKFFAANGIPLKRASWLPQSPYARTSSAFGDG